jgi:hypothetical protein
MNRHFGAAIGLGLLIALLSACTYLPDTDSIATTGLTKTERRDCIDLRPSSGNIKTVGYIFRPGALVDPHAYIQALEPIAQAGYVVLIAKEPANLAVLGADQSLGLKGYAPTVTTWAIGGHSLGGAMAALVVNTHPTKFAALVLEAAYPPTGNSLSEWGGAVLSIYASNDGLATPTKIEATKYLLPSGTAYNVIEGGCHAYFGSYGAQDGDGTPTVTRAEQQSQVSSWIIDLLNNLEG